jgi:hypothetical protein
MAYVTGEMIFPYSNIYPMTGSETTAEETIPDPNDQGAMSGNEEKAHVATSRQTNFSTIIGVVLVMIALIAILGIS